jgi:DnaJ-class molecular chaperone
MICETCHGEGKVWCDSLQVTGVIPDDKLLHPQPRFSLREPCPDCGGCGFAHCCEGLREQPQGD